MTENLKNASRLVADIEKLLKEPCDPNWCLIHEHPPVTESLRAKIKREAREK